MTKRDLTVPDAPLADGELPLPKAIDVWTRDDPRSVINLVPPNVQSALLVASKSHAELFEMDERTLYQHLRGLSMLPGPTDNRLRIGFWNEFERVQHFNLKKMHMPSVYAGVCTQQYFDRFYLGSPTKVAWLLCPPASYVTIATEALSFGLEQLREILSVSPVLPNGRIDVKLGELQAKIVTMLDQRLKGAVTQRIEQKNMNLNISTTDKGVAKIAMQGTMEDIERRLKELKKRDRLAQEAPGQAIEAEGVVVMPAEKKDG